ncbi:MULTISPECIES: DUF3352 domain-containing protein [unclassified Leptolyngbya]|uniref:DUF3352 domain-containing protein n=1 Tax=unclassified Leptolyngbya TaxID=2650499 RepID=UPI0016822C68|nr:MULTISPECIES: DUF3352 domain-containing protein [unclassified Leptolyngbya]MBD1912176.1 DUF3352 domain-containing protein [Leptolyngbya sp. FACHB-8]MBD2155067.1 DUF3352 domain-containing protein [Leptolyngbya sp. FACHB-16]
MKRLSGKKFNPYVVVATGTAIALTLGGYLGYRLARGPGAGAVVPVGVEVLPQDAVMSMTVSTNEGQWRRLRGFGTPQSRSQFDAQLVRWRDRFLTANGLQYRRDIQPWVGEDVTLAFLPWDSETPPSPSPSPTGSPQASPEAPEGLATLVDPKQPLPLVAILPIADAGRARQVLENAPGATGQQVKTRDYQGFTIREVTGQGEQSYAATVLEGKYAVVSNQASAVERVIDTYKGRPALRDAAGYREALANSRVDQPFLQLYLNGPEVRQVVAANTAQPVPLLSLTPVQRNQGVVANMTLESQGLRILGSNWLAPNSETRYTVSNDAGELPALLPDATRLLMSGGNMRQFWEGYRQQAIASPANPLNPSTFEQGINRTTGLDWNNDFLKWMDGEFALALVPMTAPSGTAQVGVVLLAQTSDRAAAEATFEKLDAVMGERYQFRVSPIEIGGKSLVNWVSPFGSLTVTHGWLDDNTAVLTLGAGSINTVLPAPKTLLKNNDLFEATQSRELAAHNGRVFVDVDGLRSLGGSLPLPQFPQGAATAMEAMQQIGMTSALGSDRTSRFDLYLRLRKEGEAPPLPPPGATPSPSASPSPQG